MNTVVEAIGLDRCWQRIGVAARGAVERCLRLAEVVHCHNCEVFELAAAQLSRAPLDPVWQENWAGHYALPAQPPAVRGEELMLRVTLGRESYALAAADVGTAIEAGPVTALPGRRDRLVHGLFQVDGQLLLAADLRRLLRPAELTGHAAGVRFARMLVLGHGPEAFVVEVDDVPGTFRLKREQLQPLPHGAEPTVMALARGVLRHGDEALTVLDGRKVIAALTADLAR
jgi:chemotaxis-related protein WspD